MPDVCFFFSSRRRHTRSLCDWSSDVCFFFPSRRRHTRSLCDWSSDVCSSDLPAARCRLLQEPRVEGHGKQLAELIASGFLLQVRENHFHIPAELPEDLTTCSARRRRRLRIGDDGDAAELTMAL